MASVLKKTRALLAIVKKILHSHSMLNISIKGQFCLKHMLLKGYTTLPEAEKTICILLSIKKQLPGK